MSNKNEVFEYLIDQLRQHVNKKDVTSFNVSVQISDLDEVKQVIHNLQQHIAGKDDEIRVLKDTLRQQLTSNPYKQQCEDLAHEVLSLKNQLRDASALVAELQETIKLMNDDFKRTTANPEYREELSQHYKDMMFAAEQSGCRKEDTQECDHNWIIAPGLFLGEGNPDNVPGSRFCCECGKREWDDEEYKPKEDTQKCKHEWEYYYPNGEEHRRCAKCGVITE